MMEYFYLISTYHKLAEHDDQNQKLLVIFMIVIVELLENKHDLFELQNNMYYCKKKCKA